MNPMLRMRFVDSFGWEWRFLPYALETPDNGDFLAMERSDGVQAKYHDVVWGYGFDGRDAETGQTVRHLRATWIQDPASAPAITVERVPGLYPTVGEP